MNDLFNQLYSDLLFRNVNISNNRVGKWSNDFDGKGRRRLNKNHGKEVVKYSWDSYTSDKVKANYPYNLIDNGNGITIEVAAIGLDIEDITIELDGNRLKIAHSKEKDNEPDYIYKKITNKSFELLWTLSNSLDFTSIDASLDKGLLSISIALKEESLPKKISIK